MPEKDGGVPLSVVIEVLKVQADLTVVVTLPEVQIIKEGVPWVQELQDPVPRRMLQYLARQFGLRIEWFFHPEMCVPHNGTKH